MEGYNSQLASAFRCGVLSLVFHSGHHVMKKEIERLKNEIDDNLVLSEDTVSAVLSLFHKSMTYICNI